MSDSNTSEPLWQVISNDELAPTSVSSKGAFKPFLPLNTSDSVLPEQGTPSGQNFAALLQVGEESFQPFNKGSEGLADTAKMLPLEKNISTNIAKEKAAQVFDSAYEEGFQAGMEDGRNAGFEAAEAEFTKRHLADQQQLQSLLEQADNITRQVEQTLSRSLQKLALHIARELVRGELSLAGNAIEQLIKVALGQLQGGSGAVKIELNQMDLERLQEFNIELPDGLRLQPSELLDPGSIKVTQGDSCVEDLLPDRLAELSLQILGTVDEDLVVPLVHFTKPSAEIVLEDHADLARQDPELPS